METETIDKLFLELSQVTKAKTQRELELERQLMIQEDFFRSCKWMSESYDWNESSAQELIFSGAEIYDSL